MMKKIRWLGLGLVVGLVWLAVVLPARAGSRGAGLGFAVESVEAPAQWCPGELRSVPLQVRNVGTVPWDPALGDRVAYHFTDDEGHVVIRDGERTALPGAVSPGEGVDLRARVKAPDVPGRYRLVPALVREQVRWVEARDAGVAVEVKGLAPAHAWSRVEGGVPREAVAGEPTEVSLVVQNDGCAAWSEAQADSMAYRWYDLDGGLVVGEGMRTLLPPLAAGERGELRAQLVPPPRAGRFALRWRPVREGLTWLSEDPVAVVVDVAPSPWAWSLHTIEPLDTMAAGEVRHVSVWLRNEGQHAWTKEQGDALAYRWVDASGAVVEEGPRTTLPSPWVPGDEDTVVARVVAPAEPGRYRLAWEPVREGVRWFGPATNPGASVPVEVTAPSMAWALDSMDDLGARWVRRTRNLRVVVRNTGAEPWTPDGGDKFSYRWYEADGVTIAADGLRTPLPRTVKPGQSITLIARVRGPDQPGDYVFVPQMVREHVRWYGPPTEGSASRAATVERQSSYWVVVLAAAGVWLIVVVRRAEVVAGWRWWAWRLSPALWSGAAVAVLVHCFVDLSGAEPWEGAQWIAVGPGALLTLALLPIRPRRAAWLAVPVLLLLTIVSLADLAYLHFFGSIVPLTAVFAVHHLADAEATVSSLIKPVYGWLLALPVLTLGMAVGFTPATTTERPKTVWRRFAAVVVVTMMIATPLVHSLVRAFGSRLGDRVFNEEDNVGRLGIVGAHIFQGLREVVAWFRPHELAPPQREALAENLRAHRDQAKEAAQHAPGFGAARGFDVLLIQVEALQGWVIGTRVGGQAITPFLDAATDDALYFDQVFDQTAQGRTSDAEYLVLGAGHPPARGALSFLYADNEFFTLAHVLADAGYSTASAHPYKRGFWNRAHLHPRYGFSQSKFRRELGPGLSVGWGLADGVFFERMLPDVLAAPEPSFHFWITLSLHHPYDRFPVALRQLDLGSLEGSPVGNYLHAIHHFDGALQELWATLIREGRADRTLLVIYGDHVTGMDEVPEILALAGRPTWDPSAHGELHRVPVFAWVGTDPPPELRGRRSTIGGHIDLSPTILHLLGMPDPRPASLGRPLVDPGPGFAALADGGGADAERLFSARGVGIPRGGGCFSREGRSLPRAECDALSAQVEHELQMARTVLEHDLHRAQLTHGEDLAIPESR